MYGLLANLTSTYQAGTKITILDSSGNEVISYTSLKSFSSIVVSNESFKKGETYTLQLDGNTYSTFTISSVSTTLGNSGMGGGQGGPQNGQSNYGGRQGGRR